ncbi:uncharacterized protein PHALS_02853 [Plasmopara halstedii]|uniref:Uncharacterized protein n=1 Tax=Plasmopara halstedii TaxID=4781 RepID=A0A0P1AY97_PLAHL|nr:uncharacterized protein PHALS_02853 [Plasmopara halstedii]CEG46452.1 hypothetical protein PHALS_02853 [Plasmopara halstedii]|eukprot:XP_024582821.1 hypothetical protein PHALS_02853 [Plasmopara halstedii]
MHFYQRRFFAYLHGSPNLHTLNTVSSHTYTLVTTDRCVSLLRYGDEGYSLQKLEIGTNLNDEVEIMASAVFERSAMLQSQIAVAYAVGESFFLQIVSYHDDCLGNVVDCGKFEIEAASACMFSVKAAGLNGDIFYGVIVCCTDVVMAFGYIENERDTSTTTSSAVCTRLDNEQLALYFSELATFSHTILTVDVFTTPEKDQGWVALGCADGLVRVLHGSMHRGCLGGPYKSKDVQQNGPVTSVALFPQQTFSMENESSTWICNMLVTCAIGQAVVYEDLYSTSDEDWNNEVLMDSDTFDTILVGITADIDFDGKVELLLGTDSQVMLAYKMSTDIDEEVTEDVKSDVYSNDSASPSSHDSSHNIWNDIETMSDTGEKSCPSELARSLIPRRKWHRLSRRHWNLETFGYIYSLLWRDINDDGVPELIIASSTGIYVYEADPIFVIDKLRNVLAALEIST